MSIQPQSPAKNNNYIVTISGFRDLSMPCQSTNLAGVNASMPFLPARGSNNGVPQPADTLDYEELTLEFIHDDNLESFFKLMEWFNSVHLKNTNLKENDFYSTIDLTVLNSQHQPSLRVVYFNCLPSSVGGVQMSVKDDNTYITNSVGVMYSHYKIVNVKTGEEIVFT